MAAITWQTVRRENNDNVMRAMEAAGQGMLGGIDRFSKVIADREQVNQGVFDRARQGDEQSYLNLVQSYQTPEALAAAKVSGIFDQRLAALDPRNQANVRGAVDAMMTTRQGQFAADNKYALDKVAAPGIQATAQLTADQVPGVLEMARQDFINKQKIQPFALESARVTAEAGPAAARNAVTLAELAGKNSIATAKTTAAAEPYTSRSTIDRAISGVAQQTLASQEVTNQVEDQKLFNLAAAEGAAYQKTQLAGRKAYGDLALKMGLRVDASGSPDMANIEPKDKERLIAKGKENKLEQSLYSLYEGDTKATEAFTSRVEKDFTPEAILRNRVKIQSNFNSVNNGAPVGTDALSVAFKAASAEVEQKEKDARNRFAPGSQDALNSYESLAKSIAEEPSFKDSVEDLPHVQQLLQKLSTKGLEVSKGTFITPSTQDVMAAIRSTYEGWNFRNKGRAEDVEKELIKNLKGSDVTELLKSADESKIANRQRAIRAILNPLTPAMAPLNPGAVPVPVIPQKK